MERDYHYPKLADRTAPETWEDAGGLDIWQRAKQRAREILHTHHPVYLTAAQEKEIRAAFRIPDLV